VLLRSQIKAKAQGVSAFGVEPESWRCIWKYGGKDWLVSVPRFSASLSGRVFFRLWQIVSVCGDNFGQPNVSWGNFSRFVEYTGRLNWFLPHPIVSALAVIVTFAEVLLGLLLLVGWKTRITALCAGILVMIFGMAMTAALGVEAPLQRFRVFGRRRISAFWRPAQDFRSAWTS